MRRVLLALVVVTAAASLIAWFLLTPEPSARPPATHRASKPEAGQPVARVTRLTPAERTCSPTARPFEPETISVPGVSRPAGIVTPPRDAAGVPGIPPLTSAGKTVFAYDREQGVRPGDPRGNVLLNAHTWPDGSALGNRLLETLSRGDRMVVRGGGTSLCYRVAERLEIPASPGLPRYYATKGRHQLAIVVCSGRRLGPGVWEKRTIWFATTT